MAKKPEQLRSARWLAADDLRSFGHRSRMMQMGYAPDDWAGRPVIGILNTWSDLNPCHAHFKSRVDDIKRGVLQAGGLPVELPAISMSETFMKPTTMLYRNLLAMEAEEQIRSQPIDGAVLMGGCDKTTPALIMGALSAGVPMIFFPAGPMLSGNYAGEKLGSGSDVWKFWDERRAGNVTGEQWLGIEGGIARSYGHCMTMGTASTMTAIAEAMGLILPGGSSIPAADAGHIRLASASGRRIVEMVWEDVTPDKIVTRAAMENAAKVAMATGCSTNAVIHLIAIARRAGVDLTLDDLDALGRTTPLIANIRPAGKTYLMEDFFYAGGLRALMSNMAEMLDLSCLTVSGASLGETLQGAVVHNDDIIRTLDNPVYHEGSLAVVKGNLAPDGAVMKPAACDPKFHVHQGPALVFDSYPRDEGGDRRRGSRRYPGPCAGAAQCRAARRSRHAGMGHAADPQGADQEGSPRHAAHLGRAHERHQLWRLHPSRRARGFCRRAAGVAANRRHRAPRPAEAASRHAGRRGRAGRPAQPLAAARAALRPRLWLDVCAPCQPGRQGLRFRLSVAGVWCGSRRARHFLTRPRRHGMLALVRASAA